MVVFRKLFISVFLVMFPFCFMSAESTESLKVNHTVVSGHKILTANYDGTPIAFYGILNLVGIFFEEKVTETDPDKDTYGYLMCGNEVIARAAAYKGKPSVDLSFPFGKLKLPVDKSYKLIVPKGAVCSVDNSNVKSDELVVEFHVDKYFYADKCRVETLSQAGSYEFDFDINTITFDGAKIILCRNDVPIMESSIVYTPQDFDMGAAVCRFDRIIKFEKGVKYTFVLPEGSVCSIERDDIVNAEARHDFVGASDRTFAPIEYSSCSVEGRKGLTELGVVTVDYSTSVQLAPGARLQLLDSDGSVKKEADATLADNGKTWTVSADFGGCVVNGGFSLCIPESTVVGTGSDITVNRRTLVPLDGSVSVESVAVSQPTVSVRGMSLMVGCVERGDRVVVCDVSGMAVCDAVADSGSMTVSLRSKGLYIVKVNGRAFKVRVS